MTRSKKKGKMVLKSVIGKSVIGNIGVEKEVKVDVQNRLVPLNKPIIININFNFENQDSFVVIESIEIEYGLDLKNINYNSMNSNKSSMRFEDTKKNIKS